MTAAVGVLCARKRVEEKQVIQALVDAGLPALPVPPAELPLPVVPHAPTPPVAAAFGLDLRLVIDRCQDRAVAAAILPLWRAMGAIVLDAGIAATGHRLHIAGALAAAGVPRPATLLVASEAAGLAAIEALGLPATLLPLFPGAAEVTLLDRDTAEAIFEHRDMLGCASDNVALLQAGAPTAANRASAIVVAGRAVAIHDPTGGATDHARIAGIAEAAAAALGAAIVGVELAMTAAGPVVWDVAPVPEFRDAVPLNDRSIAEAIAQLAVSRLLAGASVVTQLPLDGDVAVGVGLGREVTDGVALTA